MSDRGSSCGIAPALVAAPALVGCDRGDAATSAENAAPAPVATPVATATQPSAGTLLLAGDGLRIIEGVGRPPRAIPFGSATAAALKAIALSMGGPPDLQGAEQECGPGPLKTATWKGLQVYFQDDRFVGWSGAVDLKTAEGIGFGSTRAALDKAYHPQVEQTSLGAEFTADGLSGVLESTAKNAAVSDLWAGMTCIAR